ncbi:ABC transporter ATP-binding protein [Pedobacter frigoris]|uniref:ABC transporter ATP-binding protein n=1 Tax=Pedobacter frigoris TaxID=2571272 RepID=UPI00293149D9|nr:ABC transporter ATP-binding protein [Pedobacter frigoris]
MIEISNLTFGYSKDQLLFKDLNLRLSEGHIYGLLGKNGAGKSTLLKNIAGLLHPKEGFCKVGGQKSSDRTPAFLEGLFFIPEELYVPDVSIAQFVKSTAHFYPKFDEALFYKLLCDFDVPEISRLKRLSYGQQKKVVIAFGLAVNTSLLILDEPTNGLDIPSKVQFRKAIASALSDERCVIISTHQVRDLDNLIDTLLVLDRQKLVMNKSIDEILDKVRFTSTSQVEEQDVLYKEQQAIGINTISINRAGGQGKIDMELLFNGITGDNTAIIEYLK